MDDDEMEIENIVLTIKTLDSRNHTFEVEPTLTVAELKEKIRESLGLDLQRQRLIFCGRVLLDNQRLNESGIDNGKCLHLVQRSPPTPRQLSPSGAGEGRNNMRDQRRGPFNPLHSIRNLLSPTNDLAVEHQMAHISPSAIRINFIRGMIVEIRSSLQTLRNRASNMDLPGQPGGSNDAAEMDTDAGASTSGEAQAQQADLPGQPGGSNDAAEMDTDAGASTSGEAQAQQANGESSNAAEEGAQGAQFPRHRRRAGRSFGPMSDAYPRDLGRLLGELDTLDLEFLPYREKYGIMLRELTGNYGTPATRAQQNEFVRLVCDIMHSFAHCYHLISDITFNIGHEYPRLSSDMAVPSRHTIPVQVAHINLVTATGPHTMSGDRRGAEAGNAGAAATATTATGGIRTTATGATTTSATGATANVTTTSGASSTTATCATASTSQEPPAGQASTTRPAAPPPTLPDADLQCASETFNVRRTSALGHTPIHTTTRTIRRLTGESSPGDFRVEVETRGQINIPIDNNIVGGLAAVTSNLRQAQTQHERAIAEAEAARAANAAQRAQSDPIPIPTSSRRRPNMPPALIAIESIDPWGLIGRAASAALEARSAPTAPAAPSATAASSVPGEPAAVPPSVPAALAAELLSGCTLLGSAPVDIGPRSASVQGSTSAAANASQMGATTSGPASGSTSGDARGATGSAQPRSGAVPRATPRQGQQAADGSRPRILMDLENLMRSLSGGLGMEVVMNMDDMPNLLSASGLASDMEDNAGVYVTPLFAAQNAGGSPNAELLQNIFAIVRNRLMTQDPSQNQGQSQNRGQGQTQNQRQSQSNAERRTMENEAPWGGPRRRATHIEYPFATACLVYDRYHQCDSPFARQHLQERRTLYTQQAHEEQRLRDARPPAPSIEQIRERNPVFTPAHMSTMMRLLNEPITEQGQLNALFVTLSRYLFLSSFIPDDYVTPVPAEFIRLRTQLCDYIQRTLEGTDGRRRVQTFEEFCERLIEQFAGFLHDLPRINPREAVARSEIDPTATLRAMLRARMPSLLASIMSPSTSDTTAARFYTAIFRFFGDLGTLLLCFIEEGFDGLVRRCDEFVENLTENYGTATRNWLRLVAHEIIIESRSYILYNTREFNARAYFRTVREDSAPRFYCERHLLQLQPMQAPPLLPPPEEGEPSRGSTPTTMATEEGQDADENEDMEYDADAEAEAQGESGTEHDSGRASVHDGSTANGSPSSSRSEPQAEAEEESAESEQLTSESHPPGLIANSHPDVDSLYEVEELDVAAVAEANDRYVHTEQRLETMRQAMELMAERLCGIQSCETLNPTEQFKLLQVVRHLTEEAEEIAPHDHVQVEQLPIVLDSSNMEDVTEDLEAALTRDPLRLRRDKFDDLEMSYDIPEKEEVYVPEPGVGVLDPEPQDDVLEPPPELADELLEMDNHMAGVVTPDMLEELEVRYLRGFTTVPLDKLDRRISNLFPPCENPTAECSTSGNRAAPVAQRGPAKRFKHTAETAVGKNIPQKSNAETGRNDIPQADGLDIGTQSPMENLTEDGAMPSIMGSSWEPVLREDGAVQARGIRPQPPFSDAYLSGMPARKRRCLRESRADATFDALINDGEIVPGGLRSGEAELTQVLRDSVRGLVEARVREQPEDYDPTRFPNTAAFLANTDRDKTKEPEKKTPTKPQK